MRLRIAALAIGVLCALPRMLQAQAVGPQFQVNTYTTNFQFAENDRTVAMRDNGDFIVTWWGYGQDASEEGVFARRFDFAGAFKGPVFRVNAYTTGAQQLSAVAMDAAGDFVISWVDGDGHGGTGRDGDGYGIFARRFDVEGTPLGLDFQVSPYATGNQGHSTVAMAPEGDFVVVWGDFANRDGDGSGIFGHRFDASGAPVGLDFQVNEVTTASQILASVGMAGDGSFVVAWGSGGPPAYSGAVKARRFAADGTPGPEFKVNSYTGNRQYYPSIGVAASGAFVVAWNDLTGRDGSHSGIFARRFDALGQPQGPDFQVNSTTAGYQQTASVGMAPDGTFVVSWSGPLGASAEVFAQRYDAAGTPLGGEFQVNTYTSQSQYDSAAAINNSGQAIVVFNDSQLDGFSTGVFAQLYDFGPSDTEAPVVTVTSPNGGEILYTGFAFPITWTASDNVILDHVDVEYSTDAGSHWTPIPGCAALPGTAATCSWNPPGPVTTKGRIRVTATDASNNLDSDTSNANYQVATGAPFVALTVPDAAGVSWQAGTTKIIKWSHNLGKNQACSLEVNRNFPSGPWELITTNAVTKAKATSTYSWLVTSGSTSGATARIRLSWNADASIEDVSSNGFAITSRVKVTQPNGPLSWPSGATRTIKWTHNLGAGSHFNLAIDRDGDSVCEETVQNNVAATSATAGTYGWKVCGTGPARICVTSTGNALDSDVSDAAFSITGTPVACGVP